MAAPDLDLLIDGWNAATNAGFHIQSPHPNYRDSARREWPYESVPGAGLFVAMTDEPNYSPDQPLRVRGFMNATSLASLITNYHAILDRFNYSEVKVSFSGRSTRHIYCKLNDASMEEPTETVDHSAVVTLDLQRTRPFLWSTGTSATNFGSTATTVTIGTAPTWDVSIVISGTLTGGYTITAKDSTGGTRKTLSMSTAVSLTATESHTINMLTGTIVDHNSSSVITSWLTTSDFPWPLHSKWARHYDSSFPTLEVSAGSGVATVRLADIG